MTRISLPLVAIVVLGLPVAVALGGADLTAPGSAVGSGATAALAALAAGVVLAWVVIR